MLPIRMSLEMNEEGKVIIAVPKEITEDLELRLRYIGLLRIAEQMVLNAIPPKEKSPITVVGPNGMPR